MSKSIIGAIFLIIGISIGAIIVPNFMQIASKCNIVYVSQDEIMEAERLRVSEDKLSEQELFYGEVERAVELAINIPKQYENRNTKLVYSMNIVRGDNVRSISKLVHKEIIAKLKNRAEQKPLD
jgi:hypothetical protein